MAKKDREYDTILKGCKEFQDAVTSARQGADLLKREAEAAESVLKDNIAKKNIDSIRELADTILTQTATGEERIRELERKMQSEKQKVEEMEH